MRFYIKIFVVAFMCFTVLMGAGLYVFVNSNPTATAIGEDTRPKPNTKKQTFTEEDRKSLEVMTQKSKRLNVLMMGSDGGRSDTMMVVSFDPDAKLVDVISVPRDTYAKKEGYNKPTQWKINAAYGRGGPEEVAIEVEKLLQIPVHYYVNIDYEAVREIVDILEGVEVVVPKTGMNYDDPKDKPALHIHLKPGKQTLTGKTAVGYLRWRKNNGEEGEGDLKRIERQQAFVKAAFKKSLGLKLPAVIKAAFDHLETNMNAGDMIKYGTATAGIDLSTVQSYRIPGKVKNISELSFYVHDKDQTEAMLLSIYNRTGNEPAVSGTITDVKQIESSGGETEVNE